MKVHSNNSNNNNNNMAISEFKQRNTVRQSSPLPGPDQGGDEEEA